MKFYLPKWMYAIKIRWDLWIVRRRLRRIYHT